MSNFLTNLKGLQFELETVKKNLKNQNIRCEGNLDYQRIQTAICRLKKTIEDQKTIPSENSQKILKNSSPINVVELPEKINLPVVEKTLTPYEKELLTHANNFYEKELLTHAKIDVAWCRAYVQKREFTDSEHLAIYRAVCQPITASDRDLLAFIKLYPVVLRDHLDEGEEPSQILLFGFKEAKLRELDKLKLLFPNRSPTTHEAELITLECETERRESELVFLKGVLKNNPAMEKNASIVERIRFCTIYIDREKKALFSPGVPEFKGCGF